MMTRRGILRMPWQSYQDFDLVASDLFSENSERMTVAWNKIEEWKRNGNMPVLIEISAGLVEAQLSDIAFTPDGSGNAAISQDMLKNAYAMSIQRLVNAVADEPYGRHPTSSVASRAAAAGLPLFLVHVRHEAAHRRLPELDVLQDASVRALLWLKVNYWEKERTMLKEARTTLKVKLLSHCRVVGEILSSVSPASSNLDCEGAREEGEISDENVDSNFEHPYLSKEQERNDLFEELLKLSGASDRDLVAIIVDDKLLTNDHPYNKACTASSSRSKLDLNSAEDIGWKFTLRELSLHLPHLPAMLLTAIIKYMASTFSDGKTDSEAVNLLECGANLIEERFKCIRTLTCWCTWLWGKGSSKSSRLLCGNDLQELAPLHLPVSPRVMIQFDEEILWTMRQTCLQTSILGVSLLRLLPVVSVFLGGSSLSEIKTALDCRSGAGDVLSSITTRCERSGNGNSRPASSARTEQKTAQSFITSSGNCLASHARGGLVRHWRPTSGIHPRVCQSPSRIYTLGSEWVENSGKAYAALSSGTSVGNCSVPSVEEKSKRKRSDFDGFERIQKRLKTGEMHHRSEDCPEFSQNSVNSNARKRSAKKRTNNWAVRRRSPCGTLNRRSPQHVMIHYLNSY